MTVSRLYLATSLALLLSMTSATARAQSNCSGHPQLALLDFWIGDWRVENDAGQVIGMDSVSRLLNSCAIEERWEGGRGGLGLSLFFVSPATGTLKQVWVTNQALNPGGTKEKQVIAADPGNSVRFQGSYPGEDGEILDRTTLTRQPNGDVLQLIELSHDNGETWETGFRGLYKRR